NGESWKISNCTTATCTGGKITVSPTVCPNVTQPICANRRKPIKIYEQNGCCYHYECEYCVGPVGKPKQPGEIWTSECNTCECDQDSMSVRCEPVKCPEVQNPNCTESGQQLLNKTEGCCPTQTCECNFNQCAAPLICPLGFKLNITNGTCCQSYKCVPKGVCVYDMTEFKPGAKIPTPQTLSEAPLEKPSGAKASPKTGEDTSVTVQDESFNPAPCQKCYCGPKRNPTTKLNIITCTPVVCNTSCAE
ncbi:hypothetical protein XENORESO_002735, partial [Xenotaenia resolanae]